MPQPTPASNDSLLHAETLGGGRGCLDRTVAAEWRAHRGLWLGALVFAFVLSFGLAWAQGAHPFWAGAVYNLACALLLIAFAAGFGLLLVWRHIRGLSARLHFEERRRFLEEAGLGMLKYLGGVVAAVILAEAVIYLLPRLVLG